MKSEVSGDRRDFWNIRAKSFPGHREGDTYQAKMLGIAKEHGVDFVGKNVLDLGCGSGAYTIRMAHEAAHVTALDISDGMLDSLRRSADDKGIKNIEYVISDWTDYRSDKKFDIIMCSLTPAMKDRAAVAKVRDYASGWVMHIGFAGRMTANVLNGLFDLYGIGQGHHVVHEPVMKNWLDEVSIPYASYRVQGVWETPRDYDAMIANCCDVVEAHGIKPDMDTIGVFIEQFKDPESGLYISKTGYDVEMLIWENR